VPAKEFINPNLHVALIHFPLGLFIAGVLIELFSFMWRRSPFRAAGRHMILLGALLGIPTAFSGLYAFSDVVRQGLDETQASSSWNDQLAESPLVRDTDAWQMAKWHAYINGGTTVLLSLVVVVWLGSSDVWRGRLHFPLLLLILLGLVAMVAGAWYGGEMVYRHGLGVQEGAAVSMGETESPAAEVVVPEPGQPSTVPAAEFQTKLREGFERYLPPLQTHLVLAGIVTALALAALGLSLRVAHSTTRVVVEPAPELSDLAVAYGARPVGETRPRDLDEFEGAPARIETERLPSARMWLLTSLGAILTAAIGWWVLAEGADTWEVEGLISMVFDDAREMPRRAAHVISSGVIVVLPLLLALIARFAPRQRMLMLLFALILIVAVGLQVWFGILLMWDSPDGPLDRFQAV
jgi:uncharacterized membrane protein